MISLFSEIIKNRNILCEYLIKERITLSVAESCTGGLFSKYITDLSGVSAIFMGGAITYSNQSKMDILGIKAYTLNRFGAVSRETALEMSKGVSYYFKSDIGISFTGIAGPSGGTKDKPVGLVYIGIYLNEKKHYAIKKKFTGSREEIREKTVLSGLYILCKELEISFNE